MIKNITRIMRLCVIVLLCLGFQITERFQVKEIILAGRAVDQTHHVVTSAAGAEELLTDDGSPENAIGGNNLMCVNRLTPTAYPATLQTVRIFLLSLAPQLPSPVGAQIRLIAFTGAQGATQPPGAPTFLVNQMVTIPSLPPTGAFIDFQIQNGPTINSGDFYIGYQAPNPSGGVIFVGDVTGAPQQRAFTSIDNGQTFQGPFTLMSGAPINLMMRAIVTNPTTAAPRIEAPSTFSFDYAGLTGPTERTLTVRNIGDAPLSITGVTSNDPQFTVAPISLPLAIAAGAQSAITLRFSPTIPGARNATLTITSNDLARPSIAVGLSGVGGQAPNALTIFANSGAAQTGSVIAPPSGLGLIYRTEYAVFVPGGALQLKIDLSGNQNLDLYARFNQPVFSSGAQAPPDHVSNNPGIAPESISITPLSTPPLRSGLYYISVANLGPGAADFSLTVTITGGTAPGAATTVSAASFGGPDLAREAIVAGFGIGLATSIQTATTIPLPIELAGTTIRVRDNAGTERPAALFFVSDGQANFQIPPATVDGAAFLTFTSGDGKVSTGVAQITRVAPGLFAANSDGQGVAAALALRVKPDGSQSNDPVVRFDSALNRFVPASIDLGPDLGAASDRVFLAHVTR